MPIIVNDKNEIILFSHIPKNGGTSVENALKNNYEMTLYNHDSSYFINGVSPQHIEYRVLSKIIPTKMIEKSFAVVRNPVNRIVSEYKYTVERNRRIKLLFDINEFVSFSIKKSQGNRKFQDNHIRPQVDFVFDGMSIYKLETDMGSLSNDLKSKFDFYFASEIPHSNKSTHKVDEELSDASLKVISEYYKEDFERFGYQVPSFDEVNCFSGLLFRGRVKIKTVIYDFLSFFLSHWGR
ncbi:hypothetical protein VCHA48O428_90027 [Vibrio chagasii]|nr:hypothetical protein VCHA48O428_90027 [Vibrio chagasii]